MIAVAALAASAALLVSEFVFCVNCAARYAPNTACRVIGLQE